MVAKTVQPDWIKADCLHACQHHEHAACSHVQHAGPTAALQLLQDVRPQKTRVLLDHLASKRQQPLQRCALACSRSTNEACTQVQGSCGGAGQLWRSRAAWTHSWLQQGAGMAAAGMEWLTSIRWVHLDLQCLHPVINQAPSTDLQMPHPPRSWSLPAPRPS